MPAATRPNDAKQWYLVRDSFKAMTAAFFNHKKTSDLTLHRSRNQNLAGFRDCLNTR
jgi:hypothetical protein